MLYTHIPDISCFYSDNTANNLLRPAAHFEYEMILVTGGRAQAVVNHKTYGLEEGSLIFISRLERHTFFTVEEPYSRFVASMSSRLILSNSRDAELMSIFIQRPRDFQHVVCLEGAVYDTVRLLFEQMAEEYASQNVFYATKSVALLLSILIELYRTDPGYFPMRSRSSLTDAVLVTQQYVENHFHQKVTLQEIADLSFVSRHALSLAFKETMGISFKEYLLLFRVTEAKKLLITTDLTVSQIGERVGYVNVNNFIKLFREREQVTPLQYRRQFASLGLPPS